MKHRSFALEHLEGRALFSASPSVIAPPVVTGTAQPASLHAAAASNPAAGAFNVSGTYTQPLGNPDTGAQYQFKGTGKTSSLGSFTLKGNLQLPGFIASARASGRFVLTNSKGTITLVAHGPQQTPGVFPSFISFSILRGTGAYASSAGKGKITLSASTTTHKFVFRFNRLLNEPALAHGGSGMQNERSSECHEVKRHST